MRRWAGVGRGCWQSKAPVKLRSAPLDPMLQKCNACALLACRNHEQRPAFLQMLCCVSGNYLWHPGHPQHPHPAEQAWDLLTAWTQQQSTQDRWRLETSGGWRPIPNSID